MIMKHQQHHEASRFDCGACPRVPSCGMAFYLFALADRQIGGLVEPQKRRGGSTFEQGVPLCMGERGFYFLDPPGGLGGDV